MPQIESNIDFNIQNQIEIWIRRIKSEPSITEADSEELRSHFLDLIDQLKEKGLDDKEAFWVASRRMGTATDWAEEYREINSPILQIRTSALILSGALLYFLFYYFIQFSSKLLISFSLYDGVNGFQVMNWTSRFLLGSHIVVILMIASIYFFGNKVISSIERINLKPGHTIFLLLTTLIFAILNIFLSPMARNLMNEDHNVIDRFIHIYRDFNYTFPLVVCIGFVLIYFKYYKIGKNWKRQ